MNVELEPSATPSCDALARVALALDQELPSAPDVVARLVPLTEEDADTEELIDLIDCDPALTARILRTANSSFFGQARTVTSVRRAVVVLGLSTVRNLSLGFAVWNATVDRVAREHARRLWDHSLAIALAAQHLAARSSLCDGSEAFTVGLLHDVGTLVLARHFGADYQPLLRVAGTRPGRPEREREAIGTDHAAAGALLLERWRLPTVLVEAVADHHASEPTSPLGALIGVVEHSFHELPADAPQVAPRLAAAGVDDDAWQAFDERRRRASQPD